MREISQIFRTLGDPTRLRILRLLAREALNVSEITTLLGMAQPSVSKQLAELRRAGLVGEERTGAYAYYHVEAPAGSLAARLRAEIDRQPDEEGDLTRLADLLRRRTERGGRPSGLLEPGRSWPAWARAMGWLIPACRVADLGCGDGALTAEIARWAEAVIAVDHDAEKLARARTRLDRQAGAGVEFLCESIEALSLPDGCVDLAILSQALHYAPDPSRPVSEAARILVPGGRLLVLDLAPHEETWVRDKLGHVHLGFDPADIQRCLHSHGFENIHIDDMARGGGQRFHVLVATGVTPSRTRTARRDSTPRAARARRPGRVAKKTAAPAGARRPAPGRGR